MAGPWEKYANPATRYGADPTKVRQEQRAEEDQIMQREAAARAAQAAERAAANSEAANALARERFEFEKSKGTKAPLTAKERADAVAAYNSASSIDRLVAQMEQQFKAGPGATTGIRGALDYLPFTENQQFDRTGNSVRGHVGTALGFTGGQLNSVAEAEMAVGPYLPASGDRDAVILDKIQRLKDLANDARTRSTAILGGVPDQYGNIGPVEDQPAVAAPQPSQPQGRDEIPAARQGVDKSTVWLGDSPQSQGSGFVPYGQEYRLTDNPALKGVNARINGMLQAGASKEDILGYAQSAGVDVSKLQNLDRIIDFRAKNPNYKGGYSVNVDDMYEPMTRQEQMRNNAPQTRLGTAAATALNAGGFGIPQALAGDQLQYLRDQNPVSAFAGDVTGIVGATSALGKAGSSLAGKLAPSLLTGGGKAGNIARAVAPDAAYGAIYGGVTEGDPLTGAATAALGSGAGQLLGKGLQKTLTGVTDPAVQYLTERGIPLTIGQTLGNRGIAGRTMNKLESVHILGDMLARNRMDGLKAFEREALNDVVSPIGGRVTTGGTEGLEQAQGAISQAYGDALSGVNVRPDAQFIGDAQSAMQAGAAVPKYGEDFTYMMNQEVGPVFGQGGQLSGPQLQSALQSLGKIRSGFAKNPDAMASYAADATSQMDDALTGLVSRQSPDTMPAYNAAKGAFQRLAPFENARMTAINQEAITPAQLARSITNNTKNFGGRAAAARGDNLTDLIRYGQEVLPPTVPNSGTADRLAGISGLLLPTALGGASYGVSDLSPTSAGALAALAALSTKAGQNAAQKALAKRPKALKRFGGMFGGRQAQKGLAGMVTAPLLIED